MASEIVERQMEAQEFTFHGMAVAEIRRGLVMGLNAMTELERIRGIADADEVMGRPWAKGTVPIRPSELAMGDIANALLWLETTTPRDGDDADAEEEQA